MAIAESIEPFRSRTATRRRASDLQAIIDRHPELQTATGIVPLDWVRKHWIGTTRLDPQLGFVDLARASVLTYLQEQLGQFAGDLGIRRIDHGALLGPNRRLTQAVASHFYELLDPRTDKPLFSGISYVSSLDLEWRCWAVFDQRSRPVSAEVAPMQPDDIDLAQAAERYGLTIEAGEG